MEPRLYLFVIEASQFYGMTDLHKVIKVIRDNPSLSMYLTPAVSKASVRYHYYNLKYEFMLLIVGYAGIAQWLVW